MYKLIAAMIVGLFATVSFAQAPAAKKEEAKPAAKAAAPAAKKEEAKPAKKEEAKPAAKAAASAAKK